MQLKRLNRREFGVGLVASASLAAVQNVRGANDRIRVAIVGNGRRALLKDVLAVREATNAEVAVVCEAWRQKREEGVARVKQETGKAPEECVHFEDVLARKDIDAVIIGTPDHTHSLMLRRAANAKKDVYVEKPLAMNMAELIAGVDAAKRNGIVVQIGTQLRSSECPNRVREFVSAGGLGKLLKIEQSRNDYEPYWMSYGGPSFFQLKPREADVDWKAFLMNAPQRPFDAVRYQNWYGFRDYSQGPHTNLMVHFIDLVHFITGAKHPKSVVAHGGTYRWKGPYNCPDSVEVALEYPEDFLVRYCSVFGNSANSYTKYIGTRGVIDFKGCTVSGEGSGEPDKILPGTELPQVSTVPHMQNFFECMRTRKPPIAPIEAGFSHGVAVIMADMALVAGRRMVYDPVKRSIHAG